MDIQLDNKKVICEYWALKNDPDIKVVGTEKPIIINLK